MYRSLRQSGRILQQVILILITPLIARHGLQLCSLFLLLLAFVPRVYPDDSALHSSVEPVEFFYQQLRQSGDQRGYRERQSWFNQMASRYPDFDNLLISPQHEDDFVYNYLWMQQHQQGYRHRDGTDGVNKLFRMGVKALYKSYYGNNRIRLNSDDDISSSFSDVEYKLGLSTDRVRLGLEYDF